MPQQRFILQPSQEPGFWVATDTEHGMVVKFKEHMFNETHHPTLLNGEAFPTVEEALRYATYMRELGDWLAENHRDIIFSQLDFHLTHNPDGTPVCIISEIE